MSEAAIAVATPSQPRPAAPESGQPRIAELRVSGHLMTLDAGLFCVFRAPGSSLPNDRSGLPGVRISVAPGPGGRPESVSISTFRPDGWLGDDAALVRVSSGPAQILVTVYQAPQQGPETAPRLQVLRLSSDVQPTPAPPAAAPFAETAEIVAHVQRTGDVGAKLGDWIGTRGSKLWMEGFSITPASGVAPEDIEYQAVLGRGWLSPWVSGGKFCGSRGMALPLLGLRVRLREAAAKKYSCSYAASFVDGTHIGPVAEGEACESERLAPLEAFQLLLSPRSREPQPPRNTKKPVPAKTAPKKKPA